MFISKYKDMFLSKEQMEDYKKSIHCNVPKFSMFGLTKGPQKTRTVEFYLENHCREVVLSGVRYKDYVTMSYFDERTNCMIEKNIPLSFVEEYLFAITKVEMREFAKQIEKFPNEKNVSIENGKEFCFAMNENFSQKKKNTIFYERICLEDSICNYSQILLEKLIFAYRIMAQWAELAA